MEIKSLILVYVGYALPPAEVTGGYALISTKNIFQDPFPCVQSESNPIRQPQLSLQCERR